MDRWRQHRRVDELVQAMEMSGILKSSVSRPCEDIDERVNAFLNCYPTSRAHAFRARRLVAPAKMEEHRRHGRKRLALRSCFDHIANNGIFWTWS